MANIVAVKGCVLNSYSPQGGNMARTEIGKYLAIDTRVCGGRLIFKDSRIMVSDAIELSQAGYAPEQIADQYSNVVKPEAVEEALRFVRQGLLKEVRAEEKVAA
jgi:uncharacterized protein (DUF433 family)